MRPARRRRSIGAWAPVVLSALALLVAFGALVSLRARSSAPPPTRPAAASVPGRRQLIAILGVLRRRQVPSDLPHALLSQITSGPLGKLQGGADVPLVRYATTTPWGERLYFVPIKPPPAAARPETLLVLSTDGGGGAGDARSIEAGQGIGTSGGAGIRGTRVTIVVPDRVARVTLVLPRQPDPQQYGARVYPNSLTVTAPVRDNVVAVQIPRDLPAGPFPMIWYAPNGQVVKRIGALESVNRVVPTPQPGPETPLSRAAERNPATPNRVWVTPRVGGPHTLFMVHFRLLLNGASYSYRLSGTRCPAITVSGGSGGGTDDLRGRIWSDQIQAIEGQAWCPGTYRVSVSTIGGPRRVVTYPAPAFGTATFTVKR